MRWLLLLVMFLGITESLEAGQTRVRPSIRRDGSYVQSHFRTSPNHTRIDNWSTKGNVNPYTGKKGSKNLW